MRGSRRINAAQVQWCGLRLGTLAARARPALARYSGRRDSLRTS